MYIFMSHQKKSIKYFLIIANLKNTYYDKNICVRTQIIGVVIGFIKFSILVLQ